MDKAELKKLIEQLKDIYGNLEGIQTRLNEEADQIAQDDMDASDEERLESINEAADYVSTACDSIQTAYSNLEEVK